MKRYDQTVFRLTDGTETDFTAAQFATDVAGVAFKGFLHRGFHIHLHGEMHAAAQIQTQEHRIGIDFRHPFRAVGQKVQSGNVTFAQSVFDDVPPFELGFRIFETHFQRIIDYEHAVCRNVCCFQCGGYFGLGLGIDDDRLPVGRYLHGRRFAEKVGQRVNHGQNHRKRNQQVFP